MRTARNVAIILALAAVVAFVPGGGNAADTINTALFMAFLAGGAFAIYVFSRNNEMLMSSLADTSRILLYGGLGLIALLIAGTDMLSGSGGEQLLWIALLGAAIVAIWRVWVEATTYQ